MNDRRGAFFECGRGALYGAIASWAVACGGAPPPPPVASPPVPPPPPVVVVAPPDMSEVAEPNLLVGIVRWKNPQVTLDTIYQWTGVHLNPADLASEPTEKKMAEAFASEAPVDLVVALDPKA